MTALITVLGYVAVILIGIFIRAQGLVPRDLIRCHTNFRHPFNLSWSGKTCDIRRSSKTTS